MSRRFPHTFPFADSFTFADKVVLTGYPSIWPCGPKIQLEGTASGSVPAVSSERLVFLVRVRSSPTILLSFYPPVPARLHHSGSTLAAMERDLSYPTQSRSVPAVSDHSSPSFSWDVARSQLQQPWDPSQMLYGADQYSDSEDVWPEDRTIPPSTRASDVGHQYLTYPAVGYGHPTNLPEDDRYQPSHLTRISDLSYPAQSRSVPAVLDHPPPTFSCDVAPSQLQQPWDRSQMLYAADQYSNGEDVSPQDRTIPPLTQASDIGHQFLTYPVVGYDHPTNSSEDDQYQPSRLTRISALAPPSETYGTQDYAPHAPPVTSEADSLVAFMGYLRTPQPPNGRPLPPTQSHTLNQIYPAQNSQYPSVDNADASYSPHPVENNGGSSMYLPFKPPPHDTGPLGIDDTIQIDGPKWTRTTEYGYANSMNLGGVGGRGLFGTPRTFCGFHESQTSLPYYTVPPSEQVLVACDPTAAYPPIVPNTADQATMNVGTQPLPLDYTAPQAGGGDDRGRMGGNHHVSGPAAQPNELSQQQPYSSHCLRSDNIGGPSVHGGSPGANHSGTGPPGDAPAACVVCNPKAPKHCGWQYIGGGICDSPVTCSDLPHHLATFHGIKDIPSRDNVECRRCSPPQILKRKGMLRHYKEVHLNHQRRRAA
ncbi:hypothetical protein BKA83DRAFT_12879 [Pisolithus microcarpus]|nr:hypothetical protein BKA83DRAFT_12879 [Pisolithus microcarpus]